MIYTSYKQRALRQRRVNHRYRQLVILLCSIITLLLVLLFTMQSNPAKAEDWTVETYRSVQIQPGDCLWDLAHVYKQDNMTVEEYIIEIRRINHLRTDELVSGEYLILPIYTDMAPDLN